MNYFTDCQHSTSTAARLAGENIASAWECEDCGHLRPFTDEDYVFANTSVWMPPRIPGNPFAGWAARAQHVLVTHAMIG